jgi:hypothetical protein
MVRAHPARTNHYISLRYCAQGLCSLLCPELPVPRITLRLLKGAVAGRSLTYETDGLEALPMHCAEEDDAAKKDERQVKKSVAAMLNSYCHNIQLEFAALGGEKKPST